MANRVEGRMAGRFFKHGGPEGIEKPAPLPRQQYLFFRLEIVEKRSARNACRLRDGFQRCPFITVGDKKLQACFRDALQRLALFALAYGSLAAAAAPMLFVILWSSGFIGATPLRKQR